MLKMILFQVNNHLENSIYFYIKSYLDNQEHFIRRLPLVHTALKAYENSSSVVKYGAEMIESYAGPIYDKLGYDRKLKEVFVYKIFSL